MCLHVCARIYKFASACLRWTLQCARCGTVPYMSRDAELHSCWAVNHDPHNSVLLSQHDKHHGFRFFLKNKKTSCQPRAANPTSLIIFLNIYSLNNIFLESKSWYYAKNRSGSDKREKGDIATQQFCLYQETSCIEFNGPALKAAVWITRGSNEESNTLTGSTKPWRTSLVPLYPLMQL